MEMSSNMEPSKTPATIATHLYNDKTIGTSTMSEHKYTENQEALLTYLATATDSGLYINEETGKFGEAFETLNNDLVGIIKTKAQAKAALNQLVKKRIFAVDDESYLTLTQHGAEELEGFLQGDEDAAEESEEDLLGDVDTEVIAVLDKEEIAAEAAAAEEEEDLLGDVQAAVIEDSTAGEVADALAEVFEETDKVVLEQVVSHTENYTVNEWTDADEIQWTQTVFADGSSTLKRRRLVSGSWRTDYWGAEFSGDKEKATTSKLAKLARVNNHFTHNPEAAATAA